MEKAVPKAVTNRVISDKVVRERTFEITQGRTDRRDAIAQLLITVDQVLGTGFTGCIEVHCTQGRINNVKTKESAVSP